MYLEGVVVKGVGKWRIEARCMSHTQSTNFMKPYWYRTCLFKQHQVCHHHYY